MHATVFEAAETFVAQGARDEANGWRQSRRASPGRPSENVRSLRDAVGNDLGGHRHTAFGQALPRRRVNACFRH